MRAALIIAITCFLSAQAVASEPCKAQRWGGGGIIIEAPGQWKEFALKLDPMIGDLSHDFGFHGVAGNYACKNCYETQEMAAALFLGGTPDEPIEEILAGRPRTFVEASVSVMGHPPLTSLGAARPLSLGKLSGKVTNYSYGDGQRTISKFYVTDGCISLLGVIEGVPNVDAVAVARNLDRFIQSLEVTEVKLGTTTGLILPSDKEFFSPPRSRMPITAEPFTLDDIRSRLGRD